MANQNYIGGASVQTQIDAFTISAVAADQYKLQAEDEYGNVIASTATYTVPGSPTNAAVATALAALWTANATLNDIATASTSSAVMLFTSANPGVPQYIFSVVVSGSGTVTKSSYGSNGAVANSGPCDWNTLANWSGGTLPASGDTVTLGAGMLAPIKYGLNQSSVTLSQLYIDLASQSVGQQNYALKIGATNWLIGSNPTGNRALQGAGRIALDFGAAAFTGQILAGNKTPTDAGQETIRIKGTNAANVLGVSGGIVGVATNLAGDTATIPTISASGGILNIAPGVTTTTVTNDGATITLGCAATTVSNTDPAGVLTLQGTGEVTTLNAIAGTINAGNRPASGSAIGTLNLAGGTYVPTVDFSVDPRPATVGALALTKGVVNQTVEGQISFTTTSVALGTCKKFTVAAA